MTDSDRQPQSAGASIVRYWQRVPILIRAIVLDFVIFEIGVVAWVMILAPLVPAPWSFLAMGGVLWLYWKYFSGSWWPRTTAEVRRHRFRSTKMPATIWKWGLVAAALFVVVVQSGLVITFRLVEFPADTFTAEYNLVNFSFWWSDVAGTFDKQTVAETGIDVHFVVWVLILVASVAAFVLAARKTLTSRRQIEGALPQT